MKVFVSATSGDLKACRDATKNVLLQAAIQPVTQEVLSADHRSLPEMLDALVQGCDAVICLVGEVFGAAPENGSTRSYTQREYDVAKRLGKPIFVYMTSDRFYEGQPPPQSAQEAEWQREHREGLMREKYCRMFGALSELEREVGVAIWSIRCAGGTVLMHYYDVPPKPAFFEGRREEKAQLIRAMSKPPGVIVVVGMAGQGKSTLVHHVVLTRQEDNTFPFHGGFWATAGLGGFTFDMFLDEALSCFTGGQFDKVEAPQTRQRAQRLLGEMQKRPVLVVIDQIERWLRGWESSDPDHDRITYNDRVAACDGLEEFLAQATGLTNGSHLIVTSRAIPAALDHTDKSVIPVRKETAHDLGLKGLEPADAVGLLRRFELEASDAELAEAAARLGYHPMAICVFAAYVKRNCGGLLNQQSLHDEWDLKKTLTRLFEDVYTHVPGGAAARRLLTVAACSIEDAPLDALEAAMGPTGDDAGWRSRDFALTLADWQVISFDARHGVVGMHALLKDHFGMHLSAPERVEAHRRFARWYERSAIPTNPATLADMKPRLLALRHALAAGDTSHCEQIVWGKVAPLYTLVEWLGAFGHFVYGADLLANFAATATGHLLARVRIARAALLRAVGEHGPASADLDDAIAILLRQPDAAGPDRVRDLAGAHSNRGIVMLELARYKQSLADFDRALELVRTLPDDDDHAFQRASVLANRAMVLRETGQLRAAIDDCNAAIETHRQRLEPAYQILDVDLASALINRGNAHYDLCCFEAALADCDAALAIYSRMVRIGQSQFLGPQALTRILRGSAMQEVNKHTEAVAEFDEAVAIYNDLLRVGKPHFDHMLAYALMRRALSLAAVNDIDDATKDSKLACETYQRHVQRGRRNLFGPHAHAMIIDAVIRYMSGDHVGGAARWREAIIRLTELIALGETDLRTLIVHYSVELCLATYRTDGGWAAQLIEEALDMAEPALNSDEPSESLQAQTLHDLRRLLAAIQRPSLRLNWPRVEQLVKRLSSQGQFNNGV